MCVFVCILHIIIHFMGIRVHLCHVICVCLYNMCVKCTLYMYTACMVITVMHGNSSMDI